MGSAALGPNRAFGCRLLGLVGALAFAGWALAAEPTQVHFANSCGAALEEELDYAVTLLHSFEYPETRRLFSKIIDQNPDCAMAYWGAAMSIWHPLWAPPSKADLEQGAAMLAKTDNLTMTPREKAYVDAIKAFFSSTDPDTHRQRAHEFELRMSEVYAMHLDDPEAALFYSLALLASADPRDRSYANQFKSAGLLNWVRISQPTHPGVLHYLIHSYDFPGMAHLALDAAKIYADAAPDSAHAQHMPSHIFTRLGLWERSLASNRDSSRSAAEYTERANLPGHYDEGLHSMDYLIYALLQTARDAEARELLVSLANIKKTDAENFKVAYTYAASPARYALERREWEEASQLEMLRPDFAWREFAWAESIHHFARGIGAVRSGQVDKARRELAVIEDLQKKLPDSTLPYWREEVGVHVDVLRSWVLLAEGEQSEAFKLASAAANREDAVDKHPVTPGEVLPARELYADMLLETGAYDEALEQYRIVLSGSPNRLNALLGAASAAVQSRDNALADQYYEVARNQTRSGNRQRIGLAQAWAASP